MPAWCIGCVAEPPIGIRRRRRNSARWRCIASSMPITGRRGWAALMVMIDDATGMVTARFYEKDSWASASDSFQRYARRHGLPRSLYVDQHSIYRPDGEPTDADLLDNCPPETQFGRAMRELDVELILARSPQAKRARGAHERNASGPVGQGAAACEDLRHRVGEPLSGRHVSGGFQRTVRGGSGWVGGLASSAVGRHGSGTDRVDPGIARGGQGLDIALAESHLAIAARDGRVHSERSACDGLRAAGRRAAGVRWRT